MELGRRRSLEVRVAFLAQKVSASQGGVGGSGLQGFFRISDVGFRLGCLTPGTYNHVYMGLGFRFEGLGWVKDALTPETLCIRLVPKLRLLVCVLCSL